MTGLESIVLRSLLREDFTWEFVAGGISLFVPTDWSPIPPSPLYSDLDQEINDKKEFLD